MSYLKPWKVCQDYALGILNVNLAIANLIAQRAGWLVEHGTGVDKNPFNALGVHNAASIPRAMLRIKPTSIGGFGFTATLDPPSGIVPNVAHLGTGIWQVSFSPYLSFFFGDPKPAQTGSGFTRVCHAYSGAIGGAQTVLNVRTYELTLGDFALTDYEFSMGVYSYA